MLSKMIPILKDIIDYPTISIIVITGIYTFISDTYYYKKRGLIKEIKIIKGILYSYISIGIAMYVFLLIV